MKIAIITQPLKYNYGGILQNYALQQTLRDMGHEVETLEFLPGINSFKGRVVAFLKRLFFVLVDDEGRFLHIWKGLSSEQQLSQNTRCFIRKHISLKQRLNIPGPYDYDAYVVGSDQVWRPMYSNLDVAFLKFTEGWKNVKRIAYAASFGTDTWEYSKGQTLKYSRLVKGFDGISVRELSGVKLCNDYLNVNAYHVLDPTLLHDKYFYVSTLEIDKQKHSDGELFYYLLDYTTEKEQLIRYVSSETQYRPFTVNSRVEDKTAPINERIQPPIEKWVRSFMDAKIVITDSFHGMVFSLIFNIPFVVFYNPQRGNSRFLSLLSIFNQKHRLINSEHIDMKDVRKCFNEPNVDFSQYREQSYQFLTNYLSA